MKFEPDHGEQDFWNADPRVVAMALYLDRWLTAKGWGELVVTDVLRTRADMVRIYGPAGEHKPSPHLDGRAVDFRVREYTAAQRAAIDETMSRCFADGVQDVCILHDVGAGLHGHLQVSKPRRTA